MFAQHQLRRHKWTTVLALTVVILAAPAAPAFYWVGWPGGGTNQPPTFIPTEVIHDPPIPKPPGGDPPGTEEPPDGAPEPATMLLAGIGLAGVAGVRWVRRRRK